MASVPFNKGALVKEPHMQMSFHVSCPQGLEFCLQCNVYTVGLDYFFGPSLLEKLCRETHSGGGEAPGHSTCF